MINLGVVERMLQNHQVRTDLEDCVHVKTAKLKLP